jgi:hypothetical protein
MNEAGQPDEAASVLQAMLLDPEVARLLEARPHVYPPSVNPPFYWRNGVVTGRRSDNFNMNDDVWLSNNCQTVHWSVIVLESTPNGNRRLRSDGHPTNLSMAFGEGEIWAHCFGSCMFCWRTQKNDFADSIKTPNPLTGDVQLGRLPQLGSCGCVVCNECILKCFKQSPSAKYIPCPYCGIPKSFLLDVKSWMISTQVFSLGCDR